MKSYEQIEGTNKSLKVHLFYNKGGMNYFNGKEERRGYYLSVTPVEIEQRNGYQSESFLMFSGVKRLVLEVKRQSDKAYNQAVAMHNEELKDLREYVLAQMN
jgi:galactokinase/mevalonate kinase-like predicted kinase